MKIATTAVLAALLSWGCRHRDPLHAPLERELPATQVTGGQAGGDKDPQPSADGTMIFYASSSFGLQTDLYVKRVGSNTTTRLASLDGDVRFPAPNPVRPHMVAFCSNARGDWDIYIMKDYETDPGQVVVVSQPGMQDIHPSWSPDGKSLVYCSTDNFGSGAWTLRFLDLDSARTRVVEEIDGLLPEWSPTGDRIVFQRMKKRDGWLSSIWTVEVDNGTLRHLTSIFSNDDWAAINPSWSPDGSTIVFATVGKSRARAGILHEADDLWTVRADGSEATRLTTSPAADWMPAWSGDGRVYFVSDRNGTHRPGQFAPDVDQRRVLIDFPAQNRHIDEHDQEIEQAGCDHRKNERFGNRDLRFCSLAGRDQDRLESNERINQQQSRAAEIVDRRHVVWKQDVGAYVLQAQENHDQQWN